MKLTAKNWDQFQHYKNRQPPWIKLHRDVINSFAWARLQTASKALAPCLWMLASESMDGIVNADIKELAWKFGMTENEVRDGIDGLVKAEFFALEDAPNIYICSNIYTEERVRERDRVRGQSALAPRLQDASTVLAPEPRGKRAGASDPHFEDFWAAYPRKVGKGAAGRAWAKAMRVTTAEAVGAALRAAKWPDDPQYIPHPATWLNQGRWDDEETPLTIKERPEETLARLQAENDQW
jgi:hypothetical protein